MPHPHSSPKHNQNALATYLVTEMHDRKESLACVAAHTGCCPELLNRVLQGQASLTPLLAHQLASHWDISPGLLWHWQQDISSQDASLQARAG